MVVCLVIQDFWASKVIFFFIRTLIEVHYNLLELGKAAETRQRQIYAIPVVLTGMSDTVNKHRVSQSRFVHCSDCGSHYWLPSTS